MKFNKLMLASIILLAIISLGAVSASDDNITDDNSNDELSVSEVDEDICQANDNVVTSDNFFDYFDESGSLKSNTNITLQGDFDSKVNSIYIAYDGVNIDGSDATFNNMGINIVKGAKINGLTLIADSSLGNLINVEAENVLLSNLTIIYNVDDEEATAINVCDGVNVSIVNNNIQFESHATSDSNKVFGINIEDSYDVFVDSNVINASFPILSVEVFEDLGMNNLNPVRAKTVDNLRFTRNKINVNANDWLNDFGTIQSMLISAVTNSIIDYNNFTMIDTVSPLGNASCLYGISFCGSSNLTISNNNFNLSSVSGRSGAGTAYPLHGSTSQVDIIGNNLTSKGNGPVLGIYVASTGGQPSELLIEGNYINVTGYADYYDWALVSGVEIQNGAATIRKNKIYSYNINDYSDNNYIFGISYAQWIYGQRSFDIRNNTVVTQGKYAISTIATKEGESTPLTAINNRLQAHDLNGSYAVYAIGDEVVISNNTDISGGSNSSGGNGSNPNSTERNDTNITVDAIQIDANSVWQGDDNTVTVTIKNQTGTVVLKLNENTFTLDLIDGRAYKTFLANELDVLNTVTVTFNNLSKTKTFRVLNGVITKDNVLDYFNQSNKGTLYDYVPEGVTLDFQGEIKASEIGNFNITISKPVNIISSTNDAYIDLDTHSGSYDGSNPGDSFSIIKSASGTNITEITLHNTQLFLKNTDHVTLDNISVIVLNQRIGSGVGVTSIRENSSYITVKNCYFSTYNNEGSSTLVLAWANYCTIENNTIYGEGNIGNLFYLNTFNTGSFPDDALVNSYNKIVNNKIYGPSVSSAICRALAYMGSNNLIENNAIYYSGEGIFASNNAANLTGNIIRNNGLYNGSSMSIIQGVNAYNNYISGKVSISSNGICHNNSMASLTISGDNVNAYDNTIKGDVSIGAVFNATLKDSHITGDISIAVYGESVVISNNVIEGTLNIKGFNNTITDNRIVSSGEYAVVMTHSKAVNNLISNNYIYAAIKYGDEAVNDKNNKNTVINNFPNSMGLAVSVSDIKVGQTATVQILINENATGGVKVTFNGVETPVSITGGRGTFSISNLTSGNYTVKVDFEGDDEYAAESVNKTFEVSKYSISIDDAVSVYVPDYGNPVFSIDLASDVSGELIVSVNNKNYTASLQKGHANITIKDLSAGTYNATVIYSGDEKYLKASKTVSFIIKAGIVLTISVDNIKVGESAFIQVSSNNALNDYIVLVLDKNYTLTLVNGYGNVSVPDLAADNYTVKAVFKGNLEFLANESVAKFEVSKHDVSSDVLNVIVNNNTAEFSADLAGDATGSLIVTINNKNYTSLISSGQASLKPYLTAGSYEALITYSGDEKYKSVSKTVNFIIKSITTLKITAEDIFVGDDAVIYVSTERNITNGVTIYLNEVLPVDIIDGKGNITVSNLAAGIYTARVNYEGNEYFLANESEVSFKVSKISLSEDSITVDGTNFSIDINSDATGNLTVVAGEKSYSKKIVNGKATINVSDLTPGDYDVVISYAGDDKYNPISKNISLNIPKYESYIKVDVEDIKVDETAVFKINVPVDATGNISVFVNGKYYNSAVNNGFASVNVTGLAYGKYDITVNYLGDNNYSSSKNTTSLKVSKITLSDDCFRNSDNVISISLPDDATGNLTIDSQVQTIKEGYAEIHLSLTPGTYNILANYSGDRKYESMSKNFELYVSKYSSTVIVDVDDIFVGDVAVFNVAVCDGATGNVSVIIDGVYYNATLVNAKAVVNVANLVNGTYDADVKYYGDVKYFASENTTVLTVSKHTSTVIVDVENIFVGDVAVFNVDVPTDATGKVSVVIDGVYYNGTVDKGFTVINVPYLTNGNYNVNVVYYGDNKYNSSENTTSLTVSKYDTSGNLTVTQTSVGINIADDASGSLVVIIDGKVYKNVTLTNGAASVSLPGLTSGNHVIEAVYSGDNKYESVSKNLTVHIPLLKLTGEDIVMLYTSAAYYKVRLTSDGAGLSGQTVTFTINGQKTTAKTDKDGYASVKLSLIPKSAKYSVSASYGPLKVSNTVKVNSILSAKNLKVKKSAKYLKIKVTLKKVNGKYLKSKKITLKFKGKKYTVKTNKKGVAKFKIPKKVIKKLKAGKKYKYKAVYLKDSIKKTVKVKK